MRRAAYNQANHGDSFFVAASPSLQSCACRRQRDKILESEYHLFVCDTSGEHEPVVTFVSNTPFPYVEVGERFDDHGWERLRGVGIIASEEKPIRYTVHSKKTVVRVENGKNIIQTGLNLEPFSGDRSPAFEDNEPTMTWKEALGNENT